MKREEAAAGTSRYAACDWFYHAPLKQTEKKSKNALPPTSQIPGLSDLAEPHNESITGSRKKWINDTDSEYVKLAKQGGRQDLLKQMTPVQKKTSTESYAAPDWYTHEDLMPPPQSTIAAPETMPDYMIHEEFTEEDSEEKYAAKRGPFDFDQKTVWQRESEENEKENHDDKKVKLPAIYPNLKQDNNVMASGKGPPLKNVKHGKKCVFPPMPGKNDSVNFGKLLSNGYGDDWFHEHGDQDRKDPTKSKLVCSK